jgi:GDP-mannose 6-dehydrogenase
MKVAAFGLGHVGFTAMCCIVKDGHSIIGIGASQSRILSHH